MDAGTRTNWPGSRLRSWACEVSSLGKGELCRCQESKKAAFIAEYLRESLPMTELSARHGISGLDQPDFIARLEVSLVILIGRGLERPHTARSTRDD